MQHRQNFPWASVFVLTCSVALLPACGDEGSEDSGPGSGGSAGSGARGGGAGPGGMGAAVGS
jgi:hypothetical protein